MRAPRFAGKAPQPVDVKQGEVVKAPRGALCRIAPRGGAAALPALVIEQTAEEIRGLAQRTLLEFAYAVGELVIWRFYGGDLTHWRDHGRKATSIRVLAGRLDELGAMNATGLYRCIAGYELLSRMGGVSSMKHVTATHVWEVLPVSPAERQAALLRQADDAGWSVRELRAKVAKVRGKKPPRHGGKSAPALAARIEQEAQDLLSLLRTARGTKGQSRAEVFAAIIRAREALDAAQGLVNPKRHGR